ncbi:MAG TPA: KH domain-containing protein [Candidatus Tyrphobacter sp.]
MSAFDDEFGLFGEESSESERQSRLPGRRIAGSETIIDEVELEEKPKRERRREQAPRRPGGRRNAPEPARRRSSRPEDPWASSRRATDLLGFLAKRLVGKPDDVNVELFTDEEGQPVIELVVDPEDLGRVIGRNGRVAGALRTIARATAESRVAVDILDSEEAAEPVEGDG